MQQLSPILEHDAQNEFKTILEYRDMITTYMGRLEYRMKLCSQQTETKSASQNEPTIQRAPAMQIQWMKLPKLELLKLDGRRKNWPPFWEQSVVTIHKNPELSNIDRFKYLKLLLTGEVAAVMARLQVTSECYTDAIDLLQKCFGDPACKAG